LVLNKPGGIRTPNLRFRRPTTDTGKVVNNKELTKKGQNKFAIYLFNLIRNEMELQEVLEVWPELPGHIKAVIKALIQTQNKLCEQTEN
jgi:hypothetical protein